jgi:hypothetical protein
MPAEGRREIASGQLFYEFASRGLVINKPASNHRMHIMTANFGLSIGVAKVDFR